MSKLILACTYACNVSTLRERLECGVFLALLRLFGPGTLAKFIMRPSKPSATGAIGLTSEQAAWLRSLLAANRAFAMRGAVRELLTFDSRPWLGEIGALTLVVGGTHDEAVPRHHFDTRVGGIPGASVDLWSAPVTPSSGPTRESSPISSRPSDDNSSSSPICQP